jgi:hypothetical protein
MGTFGFLALAGFFAYLAFDAHQFERTSRHRAWAAPPPGRAVGEDPLSRPAQEAAQTNKYTAIGGIPGLFWVRCLSDRLPSRSVLVVDGVCSMSSNPSIERTASGTLRAPTAAAHVER